jgi:hypothetical protein
VKNEIDESRREKLPHQRMGVEDGDNLEDDGIE